MRLGDTLLAYTYLAYTYYEVFPAIKKELNQFLKKVLPKKLSRAKFDTI